MASVIRVEALVRGMGHEARCILETWKERSSTGRVFTRCRMSEGPPDLPDGSYEISIGEQSFSTRRWSGLWELTFLPSWIRIDDAA